MQYIGLQHIKLSSLCCSALSYCERILQSWSGVLGEPGAELRAYQASIARVPPQPGKRPGVRVASSDLCFVMAMERRVARICVAGALCSGGNFDNFPTDLLLKAVMKG